MTSQPSTLPAEALRKGHIRAYTSGTHRADVQLVSSMPRTLADIRVATDIPALDCVVGREVTVLFFDATNPADAVVIAVQGALPSGGGGGVTDHGALTGLLDDDHTQYALLAGRTTGQTLIGGVQAGAHLTLQSTAHATRGYVRAQDDLQLLSNIIRDAAGTARLTLAPASPHVSLAGDLDVSGSLEVGSAPFTLTKPLLNVGGTTALNPAMAIYAAITGTGAPGNYQVTNGLFGGAIQRGSPTFSFCWGLNFFAQHDTPSPMSALAAIHAVIQSGPSGTGALSTARGIHIPAATWQASKPALVVGIDIEQQGHASVGTAYGLRIADQLATTVRLLELGPSTPYLRLAGGANPPANMTNLYLKEQTTLRRVQWKDGAAIGAGDRVMVLV